jgi:hypothetical protein
MNGLIEQMIPIVFGVSSSKVKVTLTVGQFLVSG